MKRSLAWGLSLCVIVIPVLAQAPVLPGFWNAGEGFTSPNRTTGIDAAYRVFSVPTFGNTCKESKRPNRLASPDRLVALRVGEWFPLHRLIIVAEDRTGRVLRPLPISIEVEDQDPPLINGRSDMISDGRLLPIRTGKFRFRARTICQGTSADVFIQAVVRPK